MADRYRYAAFISYSSADGAFARKLHSALEAYRIPKALGEIRLTDDPRAKNRIYPCFRDREELASGDLGAGLNTALNDAGALIVICSPNAARSVWVEKEIRHFESLGRSQRIFAVIADGEPLASESGDPEKECFPPALRHAARLRAGDASPPDVVAGDARPGKDGFRNAWLKQVAGLAGVNLGKLLDRDRAARRARAVQVAAGLCILALGALSFAAANDARLQRLELVTRANALVQAEGRTLDAQPFAIAALGGASLYAPSAARAKAAAADAGLEARLAADLGDFKDLVDVAPNGDWVEGVNGQTARLWSVRDGRVVPLEAPALFVEGGQAVVHRDVQGYAVRDLATGAVRPLAFQRSPDAVSKSLETSGPFVAAYVGGGDSALWDLRTSERVSFGATEGLAFTPGGTALFIYDSDRQGGGHVRILASGRTVAVRHRILHHPLLRPGLSGGDLRFMLDAPQSSARVGVIDLSDGSRREFAWPQRAEAGRFSDDGRFLSLRYEDYSVGALDTSTGDIRHFDEGDQIMSARSQRVFAPGGHVLVAFLVRDHRRHVLDLGSGADIPISDDFDEFDFSPDGRYAFGRGVSDEGQLLDLSTGVITSVGAIDAGSQYEFTRQGGLLLSGPVIDAGGRGVRSLSYIDPQTAALRTVGQIDFNYAFALSPTGRYATFVAPEGVRTILDLSDFSVRRLGRAGGVYGGRPEFAQERNVAAIRGPDGVWAVWDFDAPRPQGSPGAWAQSICAQSGPAIRPFAEADRASSALRGRPWQACAWRGLASLDGWAQALRYWAVRLGGRWDFAPDECTRAKSGFGCPREIRARAQ